MGADGSIIIDTRIDESGFGKGMARLRSGAKAGALAIGIAVGAAAAGFVQLARTAEDSLVADRRLDQIAKSMRIFGDDAGAVTERLKELADVQARSLGVDDDVIKATQAKLLTFRELAESADDAGSAFDRATTAAMDMAAAGFGEAEQNAVQLGKALNDPIKGVTALSRAGVTFTDVEKKKLKALVESGKMLEAQDYMLKAIERQVGGTAQATAKSSDRMNVALSEMVEGIAVKVLPAFEKMTAWVIDRAIPAAEKFLHETNWTAWGDKVAATLNRVSPLIIGFGAAAASVKVASAFASALPAISAATTALSTFIVSAGGIGALAATFGTLALYVGLAAAAIYGLWEATGGPEQAKGTAALREWATANEEAMAAERRHNRNLAAQFSTQAESAGATDKQTDALRRYYDELARARSGLTESQAVERVAISDRLAAAEAQNAVNALVKAGKTGTGEYALALLDLAAANADAKVSGDKLVSMYEGMSVKQVMAAVKSGTLSEAQGIQALSFLESRDAAMANTGKIDALSASMGKVPRSVESNVTVAIRGASALRDLLDRLELARQLRHIEVQVGVPAGHAEGGYFATPHIAQIGERGGEWVLNHGQMRAFVASMIRSVAGEMARFQGAITARGVGVAPTYIDNRQTITFAAQVRTYTETVRAMTDLREGLVG